MDDEQRKAMFAKKNGNGSKPASNTVDSNATKVSKPIPTTPKKTDVKINYLMVEDYGLGLEEGKDYDIDEYGDVNWIGGIGDVLEKNGARKVSDEVIKEIARNEDGEELQDRPKDYWKQNEIEDWLNSKQNDNTYNYSSRLSHDINYGIFNVGDRTYLSLMTHIGGDVRGNYEDSELYDISNVDTGATGEPNGDIIQFFDPTVRVNLTVDGKEYDVSMYNGMSPDEWTERDTGDYISGEQLEGIDKKLGDWGLESHIEKFVKKGD